MGKKSQSFTAISSSLLRKICVIWLYAVEFFGVNVDCMSLKTKDFSRKTEALILNGGGENRTLVLSELYNNDYMLIAFKVNEPGWKTPHKELICPF